MPNERAVHENEDHCAMVRVIRHLMCGMPAPFQNGSRGRGGEPVAH
jgi:hypothetical protein